MATTKFGFRDRRTPVELALAPGQPAGRVVTKATGFKPNVNASEAIGGITSARSLASGTFAQLKARLQNKRELQSLSTSISSAVSTYDQEASKLLTGRSVLRDTEVFGVTPPKVGGFFNAADIVQSSSFKPGTTAVTSNALKTQLADRKQQLTSIASRLGGAAGNFSLFGSGVIENYNRSPRPSDNEVDGPTTSLLSQGGARAQLDRSLQDKRRFVIKGSTTAMSKPSFWNRAVGTIKNPLKSFKALPGFNSGLNMSFRNDKSTQPAWNEPTSPYASQWPYNRVEHTESGHIFELDDTPGAERVHLFHRSGSFVEMHPDGKVVVKSMSHQYIISMADQNVRVSGACNITVDGDASIYSRGNLNLQSDKDVNINTKQDFNVFAKNVNLRAKKNAVLDGTDIDLRYAKLPGKPVFTTTGPAVRVITGALRADFPEATAKMDAAQYFVNSRMALLKASIAAKAVSPLNFATVTKDMLQVMNILQNGVFPSSSLPPVFKLPALSKTPKESPLANPLVYSVKSGAASAYRARMFDTPDEIGDAELYQAHAETRKALGDITTTGPNVPGKSSSLTTNIQPPSSLPPVNYLNKDDFRGQYSPSPGLALGGTSFALSTLVDSLAHPTVANFTSVIPADVAEAGFVPPAEGVMIDTAATSTALEATAPGEPVALPSDVLDRIQAFAAQFALPRAYQTAAEQARLHLWLKNLAEQLRYDFPRLNPALQGVFGLKRSGPNKPISNEAIAWRVGSRQFAWDIITGLASGTPTLSLSPVSHDLVAEGNQLFVPVSATNHMGAR